MAKKRGTGADAAALFSAPLSEFVAARAALVKRLRSRGNQSRATEVAAIQKPSLSAWTVNQLFYRETGDWKALEAAGQALRQAYAEVGSGTPASAIRSAQRDLSHALTRLREKAGRVLQQSGHAASAGTLARIATTLQALAVRAPEGDAEPGMLSRDVDPPGFDALAAAGGGGSAPARRAPTEPAQKEPRARKTAERDRPEKEPARRADSDRAREQTARARKAHEAREARTLRKKEHAQSARERKSAEAALRSAEKDLAQKARAVSTQEKQVAAARSALDAAEQARRDAERAEHLARSAAERARRVLEAARREEAKRRTRTE